MFLGGKQMSLKSCPDVSKWTDVGSWPDVGSWQMYRNTDVNIANNASIKLYIMHIQAMSARLDILELNQTTLAARVAQLEGDAAQPEHDAPMVNGAFQWALPDFSLWQHTLYPFSIRYSLSVSDSALFTLSASDTLYQYLTAHSFIPFLCRVSICCINMWWVGIPSKSMRTKCHLQMIINWEVAGSQRRLNFCRDKVLILSPWYLFARVAGLPWGTWWDRWWEPLSLSLSLFVYMIYVYTIYYSHYLHCLHMEIHDWHYWNALFALFALFALLKASALGSLGVLRAGGTSWRPFGEPPRAAHSHCPFRNWVRTLLGQA